MAGELVEGGRRRVGGLGRGDYRLSIAMSEGFGETLTREVAKGFEDHLSPWTPLQKEEAILLAVNNREVYGTITMEPYLATRIMKKMQVHLTT